MEDMMTHVTAITQKPLTGIGGWLIWLAIGQVLAIPRIVYSMFKYYGDKDTLATFQTYPAAMYGELFLTLLFLGIVFYTTAVFGAHKRVFRKAFTIQVFANPVLTFVNLVWVSAVTGVPLASLGASVSEQIGSAIGTTVACLPWVAYVWRSVRVRDTFVN
jgi:hypothetical protein